MHNNILSASVIQDNNIKLPLSIYAWKNSGFTGSYYTPVANNDIIVVNNGKVIAYDITTLKELWEQGPYANLTPAGITIDGNFVYVNDNEYGKSNTNIIKLDLNTGEEILKINKNHGPSYSVNHAYEARVPVVSNGSVYVNVSLNGIKCFDTTTGQEKWRFLPTWWNNDEHVSTPLLLNNEIIYTSSSKIFAVDTSTGNLVWKNDATLSSLPEMVPVSLGVDGQIYIGDSNGNIYSINPNTGASSIIYSLSQEAITSNIVMNSGMMYFISYNSTLGQTYLVVFDSVNKLVAKHVILSNTSNSNSMIVINGNYIYMGLGLEIAVINKNTGNIESKKSFSSPSFIPMYTPSLYQDYVVANLGGTPLIFKGQLPGPLTLTATAGTTKIDLNWDIPTNNSNFAVSGYNIYRATYPGTVNLSSNFIGTTQNNTYADKNIVNNQLYYYCVTMFDTSSSTANLADTGNESSPSPTEYAMAATPNTLPILISDSSNERVLKSGADNQLLWQYGVNGITNINNGYLNWPFGIQPLGNGHVLITEKSNNRIIEVDSTGNIVWQYGNPDNIFGGDAGYANKELNFPLHALRTASGSTLITDSGNDRVIEVDGNGNSINKWGLENSTGILNGLLNKPFYAEKLLNNDVLIADTGNNRIIEMDNLGNIVWQYGNQSNILSADGGSSFNQLSNPTMAHKLSNGDVLITDMGNNRIIEVNMAKNIVWQYGAIVSGNNDNQLYGPVSAYSLPLNRVLITDKGNQRVQIVDKNYNVKVWQYGINGQASDQTGYINYPEDAIAITNPPSAPSLKASADNNLVNLSWQPAVPGDYPVTAYNIYRSTSANAPMTLLNYMPVFVTNYADTSTSNGITYYYQVQSLDNNQPTGFSTLSSAVTVTPFERLSAPEIVTAKASDSMINLAWTTPTAGTYDVSFYNVFKQIGQNQQYLYITTSAKTLTDSNLTDGTNYYYGIQGVDINGNTGVMSGLIKLTPFLSANAPQTLTATVASMNVNLTFSPSNSGTFGIQGYNIYRSTCANGCNDVLLTTVNANSTQYMDGSIFKAGGYCYSIAPFDSNDFEGNSIQACVNVAVARPQQPQNVTGVASNTICELSWTPGYSDRPLSSYIVYRSTIPDMQLNTLTAITITANTTYNDNNVINGTTYYYSITATDNSGIESNGSNVLGLRPVVPPSGPSLMASLSGNTAILNWTITNDGTDNVSAFNIYKSTCANCGYKQYDAISNTQASYSDLITRNVDNFYCISAVANGTVGANSNTVNVRCNSNSGLITLTATPDNSSITLSWVMAINSSGTYAASGYNIYRKNPSDNQYTKIDSISNTLATTFSDISAVNSQSYNYMVKEYDVTNTEELVSNSITARARQLPSAPQLIINRENETFILSWTVNNQGTDGVTSYKIYRSTNGAFANIDSSSVQTYKNQSVLGGINYSYYVTAITSNNDEGPPSNTVTGLLDFTAPLQPIITSAIPGNETADLSWSSSPGTYTITQYNVYRSQDSSNYSKITMVAFPKYEDSNILNGSTYYYKVTAVDYLGSESATSNPVTVTPYALPVAPVATLTTGKGPFVNLQWTCSPQGTYAITQYNIFRSTDAINFNNVTSTASSSYTDNNVNYNNNYYYELNAVDSRGNTGPYSTVYQIETMYDSPTCPACVTATTGDTFVNLSWCTVTAGTGAISGYNIYRSTSDMFTKIDFSSFTLNAFNDTNVINGTNYTYYVTTSDVNGYESNQSMYVSAIPIVLPGNISLTASVIDQYVKLDWTTPTAGTDALDYYMVLNGTSPDSLSEWDTTNNTEYEDHNILNAGVYYYQIVPVTISGMQGMPSNSVYVNVSPAVTAPGNIVLNSTNNVSNVTLNWSIPTQGTYDITAYQIYRATYPNTSDDFYDDQNVVDTEYNTVVSTYVDVSMPSAVNYYVVSYFDIYSNESSSNSVSAQALVPSPTVTLTNTITPTFTITQTMTITPTATQSITATISETLTLTNTETATQTITQTATSTIAPTMAVLLQYESGDNDNTTTSPHPMFKLQNNDSRQIDLSKIEIRYWYKYEGTGQPETATADYSGILQAGTNIINDTHLNIVSGTFGANQDRYLSITFDSGAGYLAPTNYAEVNTRFNKLDWSLYDQTNDWSFLNTVNYVSWNQVTVYYNGVLIWGVEPVNYTPTATANVSNTVTITPTYTQSGTFTITATSTHTITQTVTGTYTASPTFTGTFTATHTATATTTYSPTFTQTVTKTNTPTETFTGTSTITSTVSNTYTPTATNTPYYSSPTQTATTGPTPANVTLQYQSADNNPNSNSPHPQFNLINNGSSGLALSRVEIRYYYSFEETNQTEQTACDYAGILPPGTNVTSNTHLAIISGDFGNSQNRYLSITFDLGAGTVNANASVEIQSRFNKSDWSAYNQVNDYSYGDYTSFVNWNYATVYVDGELIWGTAPGVNSSALNKGGQTLKTGNIKDPAITAYIIIPTRSTVRLRSGSPCLIVRIFQ